MKTTSITHDQNSAFIDFLKKHKEVKISSDKMLARPSDLDLTRKDMEPVFIENN